MSVKRQETSQASSLQEQSIQAKCQDLMLRSLEELMPEDHDFTQLSGIFEGQKSHPASLPELNYQILRFFSKAISENCISLQGYHLLEGQAQKLEATIRGHIKIEQEMKMYLDYLESKINNYEAQLTQTEHEKDDRNQRINQLELLRGRESLLMKEKIVLLKRNQQLSRELGRKDEQIKVLELSQKQDRFATQSFRLPNQVPSLNVGFVGGQIRREIPFEGPYSSRKLQPSQPEIRTMQPLMHTESGVQPNHPMHESMQLRKFQNSFLRSSSPWDEMERKAHKKTQPDYIIERESIDRNHRKMEYERVLPKKLQSSGHRSHPYDTDRDNSQRSNHGSAEKMNRAQFPRHQETRKIQEHQNVLQERKSFRMEYEKYQKPKQIVTKERQQGRRPQHSFTEGSERSFNISLQQGVNKSMKPNFIGRRDHEVTQKKSSNPYPHSFQHQKSFDSVATRQYIRLQGNTQR